MLDNLTKRRIIVIHDAISFLKWFVIESSAILKISAQYTWMKIAAGMQKEIKAKLSGQATER